MTAHQFFKKRYETMYKNAYISHILEETELWKSYGWLIVSVMNGYLKHKKKNKNFRPRRPSVKYINNREIAIKLRNEGKTIREIAVLLGYKNPGSITHLLS